LIRAGRCILTIERLIDRLGNDHLLLSSSRSNDLLLLRLDLLLSHNDGRTSYRLLLSTLLHLLYIGALLLNPIPLLVDLAVIILVLFVVERALSEVLLPLLVLVLVEHRSGSDEVLLLVDGLGFQVFRGDISLL